MPRLLLSGLLFGLSLASCRSSPRLASPVVPIVLTTSVSGRAIARDAEKRPPMLVETTSVVVAPSPANPHCPNGRVFLSSSDYGRWRLSQLQRSRDLACLDQPGCFSVVPRGMASDRSLSRPGSFLLQKQPEPGPDGRCLHERAPGGFTERPSFPADQRATDQVLAHLHGSPYGPEGRILQLWQGFSSEAPLVPDVDVGAWAPGQPPPAPRCDVPLRRVGSFVRFSDDCGETWSDASFFSFATLRRADGAPYDGEHIVSGAYQPRGPGEFYGSDRPEIFSDDLDPKHPVYVTADFALPLGRRDVLVRSLDGGATWSTGYNYPDFAGGPKVMTSGPAGHLYVVRCLGKFFPDGSVRSYPELSWFDRDGSRLRGRASVPFIDEHGEPVECSQTEARLLDGEPGGLGSITVARGAPRGDHDVVRVLYGSAPPGQHESLYLVEAEIERDGDCQFKGARCVKPTSVQRYVPPPDTTWFHVHAIEAPHPERPEQYLALVHAQQWGGPGEGSKPVYFLLPPTGGLQGPEDLSNTWHPRLGCVKFAGDYNYGSSFTLPGGASQSGFQFLVQWPESQPGISEPNLFLHQRIVTVKPR